MHDFDGDLPILVQQRPRRLGMSQIPRVLGEELVVRSKETPSGDIERLIIYIGARSGLNGLKPGQRRINQPIVACIDGREPALGEVR